MFSFHYDDDNYLLFFILLFLTNNNNNRKLFNCKIPFMDRIERQNRTELKHFIPSFTSSSFYWSIGHFKLKFNFFPFRINHAQSTVTTYCFGNGRLANFLKCISQSPHDSCMSACYFWSFIFLPSIKFTDKIALWPYPNRTSSATIDVNRI